MGDDLDLGQQQFDFDEDALLASNAAELSGSEAESDVEGDETKLRKREQKKRKFAEMKEKKKKKPRVDSESDASDQAAASALMPPSAAVLNLIRSNMKNTRYRTTDIPQDIIFTPKAPQKIDIKPKCPFFLAIQTKLPDFQNMKKSPGEDVGSPLVVIVSAGAVRSVEIMKTLSRFAQCKIAKLFAKHFKVEEQVEMLREYHPVAVGTPHRLNKLIDIGALSLSNTRVVLIDMATDEKSFNILNSPNVREDFYKYLIENVVPRAPNVQVALVG